MKRYVFSFVLIILVGSIGAGVIISQLEEGVIVNDMKAQEEAYARLAANKKIASDRYEQGMRIREERMNDPNAVQERNPDTDPAEVAKYIQQLDEQFQRDLTESDQHILRDMARIKAGPGTPEQKERAIDRAKSHMIDKSLAPAE